MSTKDLCALGIMPYKVKITKINTWMVPRSIRLIRIDLSKWIISIKAIAWTDEYIHDLGKVSLHFCKT